MDIKRFIYFTAFAASCFFMWRAWQDVKPVETIITTPAAQQANGEIPQRQQPATNAAETISSTVTEATAQKQPPVAVTTDIFKAEIDLTGATLSKLSLLPHKASNDSDKPLAIMTPENAAFFVAQTGLIGEGMPNHQSVFSLVSQTGTPSTEQTFTFSVEGQNGVTLIKTYTFHPDSYLISVSQTVKNASDNAVSADGYYQLVRRELTTDEKKEKGIDRNYFGPAFYTESTKFTKLEFEDILKNSRRKTPEELTPNNVDSGWIAMVEQYFVSAWLPEKIQKPLFDIYTRALGNSRYSIGVIVPFGQIDAGGQVTEKMSLYVGPQEQDKLEAIAEGFDLVVDYGWLTIIASPIFWLLSIIHGFVGNWGVAIIILTLIIKVIFFPLTAASQRSMAKMKDVSPRIKQLQELYKDDRERLNKEMMTLYQAEKINPLGGCLPILVQIPVFIALYWVLSSSVELRHAPFALWITDLSAKDPYFILPVLLGISSFVQTRMNPPPPDPIQAKVVTFLPVIFTAMFLWFPSGLVLYWFVSNLVSICQQWYITRKLHRKKS